MEERDATWYLRYLAETIHRTVMATVDEQGHPSTAAIDMMDADESGLYFLTARGKGLYRRLSANPWVAATGMIGEDTMSTVAISVRGRAEELGPAPLPRLFGKNPFMYDIYPSEESRKALTVFRITEGAGEWFDLSKHPIDRADFSWGGADETPDDAYRVVAERCIACGRCVASCPQDCIDLNSGIAHIAQEHCLRCGRCLEVCPVGAVTRS